MIYEDLRPITREEYERVFRAGSPEEAVEALLRLAWHEAEPAWAERECVPSLSDTRGQVRKAAATGLGHLARRQKGLSAATLTRLRALKDDPETGGSIRDTLDDVEVFGRLLDGAE